MSAAVLTQPALLALVFAFQSGLFHDVQARCIEFHRDVSCTLRATSLGWCTHVYRLPRVIPSRTLLCQSVSMLSGDDLQLYYPHGGEHDRRFVLHVAIYEGDVAAVRRITACCPRLISEAAIDMAFRLNEEAMATALLRVHGPSSQDARVWCTSSLFDVVVSRGSVAQLQLLRTFLPSGWPKSCLEMAIARRYLASALFLYVFCPETRGHASFLTQAATTGFTALVQFLQQNTSYKFANES
ncbi:hypothetical protein SDRG_00558 [Saprolegnia diclina VS20]|uniref:Uncharacterized protein n=1 Tax=Saprolegnia diclina (strain VS20) TaxID=1156394 RepID=T0QX65_SAPDV|nr:hypothetical protein SDRG_00558 [Saprolegnia diclina VS20]EQC42839.1 hypothetical protein SDRG_00558 [Saprolegnia diclina VS20]|eukprot:XP_008604262.1 hypothetical protein SDRG_00558 [Saprolegnia diclina VS20]